MMSELFAQMFVGSFKGLSELCGFVGAIIIAIPLLGLAAAFVLHMVRRRNAHCVVDDSDLVIGQIKMPQKDLSRSADPPDDLK